jgi:hypothetical protein
MFSTVVVEYRVSSGEQELRSMVLMKAIEWRSGEVEVRCMRRLCFDERALVLLCDLGGGREVTVT